MNAVLAWSASSNVVLGDLEKRVGPQVMIVNWMRQCHVLVEFRTNVFHALFQFSMKIPSTSSAL